MKKQTLVHLPLILLFTTIIALTLYGLFAFFVYMFYLANAMLFGVEYAAKVALQHYVPAIGIAAILICPIAIATLLYCCLEKQQEKNNKEEISPLVLISNTEDFSDVTFSKEIEDKINLLQEKGTQVICYGFSQSDRRSLAEVCASKMKMQFAYIDDLTIKEFKSVENVFASSKGPYVIFADSDNPNSLKTFSKHINKKLPKGSKLILGTSNIVKLDENFIKNFKLVEANLSRGNFYEKILEVCNKKWNIVFNQTEMNKLYKNVLEKLSVFAIGSMYEKVVIEVLKKRISGDTFESSQMKQLFEQEIIRYSNHKSTVKNHDTETLDDIIISEEIKKEIKYKILASNRKMEERLGVKINNTYILYGPPGTGKTKIAKIIANELNVKFFSITASDFFGIYAHQSPSKIGQFFQIIDKNKKGGCVVFIDEIDAIGRKRSNRTDCANDSEHVMAIEKFFSCMDELKHKKSFDKIVIIGATNRLDSLDEAFSRRFAQKIKLDLPDLKSRKELLLMYSKELIVNLQESFDLEKATKMYIKIGEKTDGFSGADLENLCNSIKWNVCMDKKHINLQEIENCFNYEIERTNKQREDASPQQYLDINSIMGIIPNIMANSNIH